ncbi:MAG TPA: hypothetical protein VEA16_02335, partial [Vicinamibacterales bacterium]|nr:hypothetical protein [Vicinamibacterales bacterium]
DSPECVDGVTMRHRVVGSQQETRTANWLPAGDVRIGITAGASTPDSVVGETVERILAIRGRSAADLTPEPHFAQGSTFAKVTVDKQSHA